MAMDDDQTYGFSKPDALELVQLIGNVDSEHSNWHPVPNDIPYGIVMKTPGGGITGRSGTTISSATCTQWNRSGSTLSASTETYDVYGLSTVAVANTVFIVAIPTNIGWLAVWEDC